MKLKNHGTNIFRLKWGDKQLYTEQGGPTFIAGRRETNVFSRGGGVPGGGSYHAGRLWDGARWAGRGGSNTR